MQTLRFWSLPRIGGGQATGWVGFKNASNNDLSPSTVSARAAHRCMAGRLAWTMALLPRWSKPEKPPSSDKKVPLVQ
jgi:hypothetical protein